jgi:5-methylcytosine-specific restriction endonuclease McrA
MSKRDYIPFKERLASALAELLPADVRGDLIRRRVPADDVISLFELDHNHPVKLGGTKDWWNLTYLRFKAHKPKTSRDRKAIAKAGRFDRLRKTGTKRTPAQQKRYRPIRSRGFRGHRKFNGDVIIYD